MGNVVLVRDKVDSRNRGRSKEQSKIRVLAIERMLNEGQRITAKEIQSRLDTHYDIQASKLAIYRDICAIDRFMPIEVSTGFGGGFKKYDVMEVEDG